MTSSACHTLMWMVLTVLSEVISQDKTKSNIFNNRPIRVEDYGTPPATSTIPLYDCSSSHRPIPDILGAFEVYNNKQWYLQTCQEGLNWNQTLCRCEFPDGKRPAVECRDYRATSTGPTGKYEQLVNGQWMVRDCSLSVAGLVWDQDACQCVWGPNSKEMVTGQGIAPCEIMLNMTFENGIKDDAKGSFVEVGRGPPVPVFAVHKREMPDGYKAAYFTDTALNIWYFSGNELGTSLRVEFRFKMTNDPIQRDKYQIFLSNGCNVSAPGYTTPSIAIGYRAADQSYLLAFETANARKAIVCSRKLGAYDWHTISLIYEDGTLLFRVDDHPCIISQDFSGPVQKTPCPLTIGADPLERESMYKGYLDNILIARYCRRYLDTDPNDATVKERGPMPVETAPNVVDIGPQQSRSSSDKERSLGKTARSLQRSVTSSKYFSEFPRIIHSETGNSEKKERENIIHVTARSLGNARDNINIFRRSLNAESSKGENGQGRMLPERYGTNYNKINGQRNGFDNSGKRSGQPNGYSRIEKSGGTGDGYGNLDKSVGQGSASGNSDNNERVDGYGKPVKDSEQATVNEKSDESGDLEDGFKNVARNTRKVNNEDNIKKGDNNYQTSERRNGKDKHTADTTYVDRLTGSSQSYPKKNEQDSSQEGYEKEVEYKNDNIGNSKKEIEIEETNKDFIDQEKSKEHRNVIRSSNKARSADEDISGKNKQHENERGDKRNAKKEANDFEDPEKDVGTESEYLNSEDKNDGDTQDNDGKSIGAGRRDTRIGSGRGKSSRSGGKNENRRSEKGSGYINDKSGKTGNFAGSDTKVEHVQTETGGVKGELRETDGEDDDYVSPGEETREGDSNSDENYDNTEAKVKENIQNKEFGNRQNSRHGDTEQNDDNKNERNKGNRNIGQNEEYQKGESKGFGNEQNKEYRNTQQNKDKDNGQNKEYRNTQQNKDKDNGQNKEYRNTQQNKDKDNGQNKEYRNTQQNKDKDNGQNKEYRNGQNKEYRNTQQNKDKDNGQNKEYRNTQQNKDKDNGQNKEYRNTQQNKDNENEQNKEYRNTQQNKYNENEQNKEYRNPQQNKDNENEQNKEYINTQQNKDKDNGQNKEYINTQQNKDKDNGQNKEYINTQQNKDTNNGQNKEYRNTQHKGNDNAQNIESGHRQNRDYANVRTNKESNNGQIEGHGSKGKAQRYGNWQVYRGNIRNKRVLRVDLQGNRPFKKDEHSAGDKFVHGSDSSSEQDTRTKNIKIFVASDVSSYNDELMDGLQQDNANIDSSERGQDDKAEKRSAQSGSAVSDDVDVSSSDKHQRNVGSDLTGSRVAIAKVNTGNEPSSSETAANLVKGGRRSGSKKHNWYDKSGSTQGSQDTSSDSDALAGQEDKLQDSQVVVGDTRRVRNSGKGDTGSDAVKDFENDKSIAKQEHSTSKSPKNQYQKTYTPKDVIQSQGVSRKESGKPPIKGSAETSRDENYDPDYDSDLDDGHEDDVVNQPSDLSDDPTKRVKGEAYMDTKNIQTAKSTDVNQEQVQQVLVDTQRIEKVGSSKSRVTTKDDVSSEDVGMQETSLSNGANVNHMVQVDDALTSSMDVSVDGSNIRNSKSIGLFAGTTPGGAVESSSYVIDSARPTTTKKDQTSRH